MYNRWFCVISFIVIGFVACQSSDTVNDNNIQGKNNANAFVKMDASHSGIHFNNVVEDTEAMNALDYDYFYNGAGLAAADFNNDGLIDIFFTGNDVHDSLYINKGDFKFENQTKQSGVKDDYGWSTGVNVVDINNDGWQDIYVCKAGPYYSDSTQRRNKFYINNGNGSFTDKAAEYGLNDARWSVQSSFFDFDSDGDLDMFLLNHSPNLVATENLVLVSQQFLEDDAKVKPSSCALYQNNGDGQFTDITKQAGLLKPAFGLGVVTTDLNNDGLIDIYVANDFFIPDAMYINNGNGTFTDKIKENTNHIPFYSMGCDAGDINNDGFVDLATLDMSPEDHVRNKTLMQPMSTDNYKFHTRIIGSHKQYMFNSLYTNNGQGFYSDIAHFAGYAKTDWSWATLLADFDNDGLKDIFVTNGFNRDTKDNDWKNEVKRQLIKKGGKLSQAEKLKILSKAQSTPIKNYAFKNKGDFEFEKTTDAWGLSDKTFSNGCVYADFDNDGDLDLAINNINSKALLYKNNMQGNYLQLMFKQGEQSLNAKVTIYTGEQMQTQNLLRARGYQSCVSNVLHFGLGTNQTVDSIIVVWHDKSYKKLTDVNANQRLEISKSGSIPNYQPLNKKLMFADYTSEQAFLHRENPFDDFKKEVLLPYKQSSNGPALAVGDVNRDGLDDFFIGGAHSQGGQLLTVDENGTFNPVAYQAWDNHLQSEDVAAEFFDADNDGDLDLYVVSGGGEFVPNTNALQDRLYINRGRGAFQHFEDILPNTTSNGSCIAANDFDNDGDIDLFVGARAVPGQYPKPDRSFLLRNDKTKYTDVTEQYLPNNGYMGIVTDAIWVDVNMDKTADLVVVGEWMEVNLLINKDNKLTKQTKAFGLEGINGLWQSVAANDFDQDGDVDLLVGNLGTNNKFKASVQKPFYLYSNDFDDNGTSDIVLSYHYKDKIVPVRGKECSTEQMPFLAEKFDSYIDFAKADLPAIYGDKKLEEAYKLTATTFKSYYLENIDGQRFIIRSLPNQLQLSAINSFVIYDFNQDGLNDIVCGGNLFETEIETTPYDAGMGNVMLNEGAGKFTLVSTEKSGLKLNKNLKNMKLLLMSSNDYPAVLAANNNDVLQLFLGVNF